MENAENKRRKLYGVPLLNDIYRNRINIEKGGIRDNFIRGDESILFPKHYVIEASAGTGKTYTIKKLYFDLIYRGLTPDEILVVTFTRAATAELRKRLLEQIEEGIQAYENKEDVSDEAAEGDNYYWTIDEEHYRRLLAARDQFCSASIYTLDSLTQRILREHQDMSRMQADAGVLDDKNIDGLYCRAFDEFMHECVPGDENLLAMAYACSKYDISDKEPFAYNKYNKSKGLLSLIIKMMEYPMQMANPLLLTRDGGWCAVSENFLDDYKNLCNKLGDDCIDIVRNMEFGSNNKEIKEIRGKLVNYIEQRTRDSQSGKEDLMWLRLSDNIYHNLKNAIKSIKAKDIIKNIDSLIEVAEKEGSSNALNVYKVIRYAFPIQFFIQTYAIEKFQQYVEREKLRSCKYLYSDFSNKLVESLENSELSEAVRREWRVAIVDEFQDTSAEQWAFLKKCFLNEHSNLFVIGDPKQAIYGFRGCDLFIYKNAVNEIGDINKLQNPDIKDDRIWKLSLDTNYRSSQQMIETLNDLYENKREDDIPLFLKENSFLKERFEKSIQKDTEISSVIRSEKSCGEKIKKIMLDAHDASEVMNRINEIKELDDELKGKITDFYKSLNTGMDGIREKLNEYACVKYGKKVSGNGNSTQALTCVTASSEKECQEAFAAEVKRIIMENGVHSEKIFLLARTNRELEALEHLLVREGVACSRGRSESEFEAPENIDLLRIMRAIERPNDDRILADALNTMFFGMPVYEVDRILSDPQHPVRACFQKWAGMSRDRSNFHDIFEDILKTTQFEMRLKLFSYTQAPNSVVRSMIDRLVVHALYDELNWSALIEWYIEQFQNCTDSLDREDAGQPDSRMRVQLMTIHKCKGLEADIVFLYLRSKSEGFNDTLAYHKKQSNGGWRRCCAFLDSSEYEEATLEVDLENERLLYVAMTRAKYQLYLPLYVNKGNDNSVTGRLNSKLRRLSERKDVKNISFKSAEEILPSDLPVDEEKDVCGEGECTPRLCRELDRAEKLSFDPGMHLKSSIQYSRERRNMSYSSLKNGADSRDADYAGIGTGNKDDNPYKALPGGTNTGLFMHELLEKVDFHAVKEIISSGEEESRGEKEKKFVRHILASKEELASANLDSEYWLSVWEIFNTLCHKYQIGNDTPMFYGTSRHAAALMLWRVLTVRVPKIEKRLCDCDCKMAEAGFLTNSRQICGIGGVKDVDFFNGSIDCCCRFDETWYLIDWKTDTLPEYTEKLMAEHTRKAYRAQKNIYTSAFKKWLVRCGQNAKFGGMMYVYLRGVYPRESGSENNFGFFYYA